MAKRKKKTAKKKRSARRASSPRGGGSAGLRNASAGDLQRELQRRSRDLAKLESKRDKLLAQVEELDHEINAINAALGAPTASRGRRGRPAAAAGGGGGRGARRAARGPGGGRKRPRNEKSLEVALADVLKGQTMGVTEVADAVQAAGYQTTSPNFRTIVNQTLIKSDLIKKVGRGQYTAK